MRRLTIFAHFDSENIVDDYVIFYLKELRRVSDRIVFVSTSRLDLLQKERASAVADEVFTKDNIGYDFASWKFGLERSDLDKYDQLVLCNDSCYGPFESLAPIFEEMQRRGSDYWGLTKSYQYSEHLQSYFLVFNKNVFKSKTFKDFWETIVNKEFKLQIVLSYEIGLSQKLSSAGFKSDAFFRWSFRHGVIFFGAYLADFLKDPWSLRKLFNRHMFNITHTFWHLILKEGVPFVKIELLKKNPLSIDIKELRTVLQKSSPELAALVQKHESRNL